MNGFEDVVQLLIENKAEVDIIGKVLQVCFLAYTQTVISTTISININHIFSSGKASKWHSIQLSVNFKSLSCL
jgi:hypothetical protein